MPVLRPQDNKEKAFGSQYSKGAGGLKAELFIELEDPKAALAAMEPGLEANENLRVAAAIERGGLRVVFDAKSVSLLRGAVNSYLRLLKSVENL